MDQLLMTLGIVLYGAPAATLWAAVLAFVLLPPGLGWLLAKVLP